MRQKILIAEPREVIRIGLRGILERNEQDMEIYEAHTHEEMQNVLHSYGPDLILVHQAFVTENSILPMEKTIILADELEIDMFIDVYERKVRGYLSTYVSSELLLATMQAAEGTCLLDPTFIPLIMKYLLEHMQDIYDIDKLSRRENEIEKLLQKGFNYKNIAQQLNISASTLKTHINNIRRKQEGGQQKLNATPYPPGLNLLKKKAFDRATALQHVQDCS